MIRYFERDVTLVISIEMPISADDVKSLREIFRRKYVLWRLEFGNVYSVDTEMVHLLYEEIVLHQKKIKIFVHKYKLSRYLKKLGFSVSFISSLKDVIVSLHQVEVVLIGGSADSSKKIVDIVKNVNLQNVALVIVQHIEADKKGVFDAILQRYTTHRVLYAVEGERVAAGGIYIAPNNRHLKIADGSFVLDDAPKYNYSKPSISVSYESFSNYYKQRLLIIQECGYASDGVDKLQLLKSNGTKIVLQNPQECEAKPMVMNALQLNVADYVLPIEEIVTLIALLDKKISKEQWIEYLLEMIRQRYGYDFKPYHREMFERRLKLFMIKHDIKNIQDSVGLILFNKGAFKAFFLEISINVTELFREAESLKKMVECLDLCFKKRQNIKLWSAGCSSGEEAYSISMMLASLGILDKSIIYATDVNSVVLQEAKNALYPLKSYLQAKENIKQADLNVNIDKYVIKNQNYISICDTIMEKTHFFKHNLAKDSSFNEFDIIICKNVIIYFEKELQERVFQLFYDSLIFGGFLVLGESEMLSEKFSKRFEMLEGGRTMFRKVA